MYVVCRVNMYELQLGLNIVACSWIQFRRVRFRRAQFISVQFLGFNSSMFVVQGISVIEKADDGTHIQKEYLD